MATEHAMNGTKRFGAEHFTPEESTYLQHVLAKQLGPEWVSQRPGPAGVGKMVYVEGHTIINLANKLFGFNGWSSEIKRMETDYIDLLESGKYSICISVVMRITLKDGTFHEDIGVGFIENCKSKAMGIQKAKKEAVTDATKRAIRYFGSVMGNCIHDKAYMRDIVRIAPTTKKLDISQLYRETASNGPIPTVSINKPATTIPPSGSNPTSEFVTTSTYPRHPPPHQHHPRRNNQPSEPPAHNQKNGHACPSSDSKQVQVVSTATDQTVITTEGKREWQEDSFNGYEDDNSFLEQLAEADFDYADGEMILEDPDGPTPTIPQKRVKRE